MLVAVMNDVDCRFQATVVVQRFSRVRVDIKAREITARDIHSNTMPLFEDIGRGIQANRDFVDFAGLHQLFFGKRIPKPCSQDPVANVQLEAARKVR